MKKLIPIIFVLGILSLLIQFGVQAITKHHEVDYSIITDDNSYMINEELNVNDEEHVYTFKVKAKNTGDVFYFNFVNDYNKQDSVIKDIEFFRDGDLTCIFPIYKKGLSSNLFCNYDDVQVSSSYLRQINNESLNNVVSNLKKDGYKFNLLDKKEVVPEEFGGKYKLYKENVPNNLVFTMWFYKGFYRITSDETEEVIIFNNDRYENNRTYILDNYMFVSNTDDVGTDGFYNYYMYEIIGGTRLHHDLAEQVSDNMYFNGVHDGKIYITDLTRKKQYSVAPKGDVSKLVGDVDTGFKSVKNGKIRDVSAKDFLEKEVYFEEKVKNTDLVDLYNATDIRIDGSDYYFVNDKGNFYKASVDDIEHPILLFNFLNISEWIVKKGNIILVVGDTLYHYNDNSGLNMILQNSELIYNYKNICNFVLK